MLRHMTMSQAEGGIGDVAQLDNMLRALNFTQKKADGEVRRTEGVAGLLPG
jgi:hypothetical protein